MKWLYNFCYITVTDVVDAFNHSYIIVMLLALMSYLISYTSVAVDWMPP